MNIKSIIPYLLLLTFLSCKREETIIPTEKGTFTLEFENQVNGTPLVLGTQTYKNANGDDFNISVFNYYISNISLTKDDGTVYKIPESYILVDAAKPASSLNLLTDIPVGDYTQISFTIGIDKERNHSGVQTGALDPSLGMFWTRNSGYIFLKLEGSSPQSTAPDNSLTFHIGGAVDPNNTIRAYNKVFTASNPLRIRADKKPQMHFKVNAASLFTGKQNISFADFSFTVGDAKSIIVADNYAKGLFQSVHIHN